jgi:hypothetical protein
MMQVRAILVAAAAGSLMVVGGAGQQPEKQPYKPSQPSTQPGQPAQPGQPGTIDRRPDVRADDMNINFDRDPVGKLPSGWKIATPGSRTGEPGRDGMQPRKPGEPDLPGGPGPDKPGAPEEKPTTPQKPGEMPKQPDSRLPDGTGRMAGAWAVTADPTAPSPPNVLALTGPTTQIAGYNLIECQRHTIKDVDLTAKVRPDAGAQNPGAAGMQNQGGGLAWRIRNADNFYACSYNPSDGKLRVFRVSDGRPTELASADFKGSGPGASTWYTIGASMQGDSINCSINGQQLIQTRDSVIKDSGKIGLWAKGDSAASFDDVNVNKTGESTVKPDRDNKPEPKEQDKPKSDG